MNFKFLLTVNSILAIASGVTCVLMPAKLLSHYDVVLSSMGLVIYQFWGATLIGLGMLIWFARGIDNPAFQKRTSLALFIMNALSCIMAFRGQYAGANFNGWSMVVMFAILTLFYGTFTLMKWKNKRIE